MVGRAVPGVPYNAAGGTNVPYSSRSMNWVGKAEAWLLMLFGTPGTARPTEIVDMVRGLRIPPLLLGLALCGSLSACTETLIRRTPASGVLSNSTPATSAAKAADTSPSSAELSELKADLANLREQYQNDSQKLEVLRLLAEVRIAHLEAVADYQNIGLSILAKREDLTESEERLMYSTLSTKAAVAQALAVRVVSAIDEALPLLGPDSEEHQDLEELKESLRVKLSKGR